MKENLVLADFQAHVGDPFTFVLFDGTEIAAELVEAQAVSSHTMRSGGRAFSLIFRAARDSGFTQGMLNADHAQLGSLDGLFLVPVREDDAWRYYEAVFN
jgi:hypothetical protein